MESDLTSMNLDDSYVDDTYGCRANQVNKSHVEDDNNDIPDISPEITKQFATAVSDQHLEDLGLICLRKQNIVQEEIIEQLRAKLRMQDMMNISQATKILHLDEENKSLRKDQNVWDKERYQIDIQSDTISTQGEELKQLKNLCKSLKAIVSTTKNKDLEDGMTPYQLAALDLATFETKRRSSSISSIEMTRTDQRIQQNYNEGGHNESQEEPERRDEVETQDSAPIRFLGDAFEHEDNVSMGSDNVSMGSGMRVSMSDGTVLSWKGARNHLPNLTLPRGLKTRKRVKFSRSKEEGRVVMTDNPESFMSQDSGLEDKRKDEPDRNLQRHDNKQKITALLRACYLHNERK